LQDERYTLEETTVRFGRSKLWLALSIVPSLAMLAIGLKIGFLFFLFPLPTVIGFLAKRAQRMRVVASSEGLVVGERMMPRHELSAALVRHERDTTYVELRGKREVDVEVKNNVEADALVRALGLDAASTTLDVPVDVAPPAYVPAALVLFALASGVFGLLHTLVAWVPFACVMALMGSLMVLGRSTLRIGADGIVVKRLWGTSRFVSHDAIASVDMQGHAIVVRDTRDRELHITLREQRAGSGDEAQAIGRRILQARQTHRASGGAPELSVALDRGSRTTREWIAELRKVGAGASSTFRTIGIAREQLVAIVESTSASAKDRIAAIAALHGTFQDDEERRVRVAVDRIAAPDVRQQMVRVLDARDEVELEAELEATLRR